MYRSVYRSSKYPQHHRLKPQSGDRIYSSLQMEEGRTCTYWPWFATMFYYILLSFFLFVSYIENQHSVSFAWQYMASIGVVKVWFWPWGLTFRPERKMHMILVSGYNLDYIPRLTYMWYPLKLRNTKVSRTFDSGFVFFIKLYNNERL